MIGKKVTAAAVFVFVVCLAIVGYADSARKYHREFGVFDAQGTTIGYVTYRCMGPVIYDGDTSGTWVLELEYDCGTNVKDP